MIEEKFIVVPAPSLPPPMPSRHKADVELGGDGYTTSYFGRCSCRWKGEDRGTTEEALADVDAHVQAAASAPVEVPPARWDVVDADRDRDAEGREHRFDTREDAEEFCAILNAWWATKPAIEDAWAGAWRGRKVPPTAEALVGLLDRPWTTSTPLEEEFAEVVSTTVEAALRADAELAEKLAAARGEAANERHRRAAEVQEALEEAEEEGLVGGLPACDECGENGTCRVTRSGEKICMACIALYPERSDRKVKGAPWQPAPPEGVPKRRRLFARARA